MTRIKTNTYNSTNQQKQQDAIDIQNKLFPQFFLYLFKRFCKEMLNSNM